MFTELVRTAEAGPQDGPTDASSSCMLSIIANKTSRNGDDNHDSGTGSRRTERAAREIEIDPEIQAEIDECFAYADALRDIGIDARVVRFHDHTEAIPVYCIKVIEGVQREHGHRIIGAESAVTVLTKRVAKLERDNMRVKMPNTRSRVSRIREAVNEQSDRRMAEALRVRDDVRNLRPLMGDEVEQEEVVGDGNGDKGNGNGKNRDGGNGNRGNGNGNGNGGEYGYNFRGFMLARECTYQDFLKCHPLNFNGTEGVVGLTRWFEKMETIFHI
ncbi:hypothetical protein Tco_0997875, partial [Tanacetum coccineum]